MPNEEKIQASAKTVIIGSDHGGFTLKNVLVPFIQGLGYTVIDKGTDSTASCDYPVFAKAVCEEVVRQNCLGILICGTGIGMSMAANRVDGIRAALCTCEFHARLTRQHNNANVMCIGERVTGAGVACSLVETFLHTEFEGGRHLKRIEQFSK